ncbi:MAG: adenylate/guanylate cyclase domain-containing protein [Flavobacteriales bacterium]|nr:adenylate/guanylate cyclase domain-containing protein [Flavobacteriales bacterium]
MKHLLPAVFLWLAAVVASAQPANTDSLLRVWADTTAAFEERGVALGLTYLQDTSLTTLQATRMALPGSTDTTSRTFMREHALAMTARGAAYDRQGHHAEFLVLMGKALKEFERSGDMRYQAYAAGGLGGALVQLGQFSAAVPYQLEALRGFEALKDTTGIYNALSSIAYTYEQLGDEPRSQLTYRRCLHLVEGRDTQQEFDALIRLATNPGATVDSMERKLFLQRTEALLEQGKAIDISDELGMYYAFKYLAAEECEQALERIEHAWQVHSSVPSPSPEWISFLLAKKAEAHACAHRYAQAIALAREGLQLATAHGLLKETLDNLRPLAQAYEASGDVRNALLYTKRYQALKDSAATVASASNLAAALLTSDFKKQQFADSLTTAQQRVQDRLLAEQKVQRQRTQRNVLLGFGAFALVFAVVDYRRRRRIKQEHARSEALLLNILPQEVAAELKAKGHADAKHFDNATILFTDFKGFTEASEKLTPQELVEELNTCFKAFDHIITARGIEKIKTIGDAYMCAGGLPDPKTSSPADVVHAGLEMQAFMMARKKERDAQGLPAFEMRVGIHTGPVVAGIVGVKKFQYDIWGDTVNTASRMESSGEVGQVNISEATYALVVEQASRLFTFTPRGKVQAKGKGEMEMYFVQSA